VSRQGHINESVKVRPNRVKNRGSLNLSCEKENRRGTKVSHRYQPGAFSEKQLADLLIHNGQQLLPMIKLVEQSRIAVEELIDCVGRVTIQAVLMASAEQVAGPRQQGTAQELEILWYGKQGGSVYLREGILAVERPRLRRRGRGHGKEVVVPATRPCRTERGCRPACWRSC